ncbi:MAG: class I lanthipeptide [Spirosomataceae bacterium]
MKSPVSMLHLCIIKTAKENKQQFNHQNNRIMKKQLKKLSFSTEKIVSLAKADMQAVNGGTWAVSNGGQSHNCLASSQTYYPRCQY